MENKGHENLGHAYAYTHMRTHASRMRTRTRACVCMLGFQKLWKASFSALNMRFRMNHTSFGSHSKPLFSHYIMPYMVAFQNSQKLLKENIRFTRNSESMMEFFIKHFQVNIFLIEAFSSLDLGVLILLITFVFDCE